MIFLQSAVNLGGIGSTITGALSKSASAFLWGIGILIFVCILTYIGYRWFKNVTFYKTPVSLTILLENGTEKTRNDLRGASFMNNGIRDFKIKIPKTKAPHILGFMPDFELADGDGRLKFITSGDRTTWQQYRTSWKQKERVYKDGKYFEYDLINTPVPRETKQTTVNAIKNWRETIDKKKLTLAGMMIGGFIIMVVAHLISLFIQTKIKCPVPT